MPFPSQRRDHAGPSEFTSSPKRIAVLYYCPGYLLYDGEVSTRAVSSTTVDLVGVQLVIVLDTTGSMGPAFNVCKQKLISLVEAIKTQVADQVGKDCAVEVGYVAFQERGQPGHLISTDLTEDVDAVNAFLRAQTQPHPGSGGSDAPEEGADGLQKAVD